MMVAAPAMTLIVGLLCFEELRTLGRALAAIVCTAGIVLLVLATLGGDVHSVRGREVVSTTAPRVIGLEHGGGPLEMRLRLAVPRAWGGRLETQGSVTSSVSEEASGGSYVIEICVPGGQLQHVEGERVTTRRLEFPCAGHWEIEVRFKKDVIWRRRLEIGTHAPTPAAAGAR